MKPKAKYISSRSFGSNIGAKWQNSRGNLIGSQANNDASQAHGRMSCESIRICTIQHLKFDDCVHFCDS
jgi:hypothetical protein